MSSVVIPDRQASLDRVRRRVAALGFFAVAIHGVLGSIVAARVIDGEGRHSDAIGMLIMSAIIATLTYVVVRLILQARLVHVPWIALACLPTALGFVWVL